jgi:hypothetical protein
MCRSKRLNDLPSREGMKKPADAAAQSVDRGLIYDFLQPATARAKEASLESSRKARLESGS